MRKVVHGFTPEEQIELLKNPYTRSVSEWMIKFTDEFNDLFIKRHSQGGPQGYLVIVDTTWRSLAVSAL